MTKNLHVYNLVISDGKNAETKLWLGSSKRDLNTRVSADQKIVWAKKVDGDYAISKFKLRDTLQKAGYGEIEVALIMHGLESVPTQA